MISEPVLKCTNCDLLSWHHSSTLKRWDLAALNRYFSVHSSPTFCFHHHLQARVKSLSDFSSALSVLMSCLHLNSLHKSMWFNNPQKRICCRNQADSSKKRKFAELQPIFFMHSFLPEFFKCLVESTLPGSHLKCGPAIEDHATIGFFFWYYSSLPTVYFKIYLFDFPLT